MGKKDVHVSNGPSSSWIGFRVSNQGYFGDLNHFSKLLDQRCYITGSVLDLSDAL